MKFAKKIFSVLILITTFLFVVPLGIPTLAADEINISANGAETVNTVSTNEETAIVITQTNTARVANSITVRAHTGGNDTSFNEGDSIMYTGDATATIAVTNVVNTSNLSTCCQNSSNTSSISGNGTESSQSENSNYANTVTATVISNANITNTVVGDVATGTNNATGNSGNVAMKIGTSTSLVTILNSSINHSGILLSDPYTAGFQKDRTNEAISPSHLNAYLTNGDLFTPHSAL